MRIYRIKVESNAYQHFLPDDEAIWGTGRLTMDCSPKLLEWTEPKIYILKPKLKKGNFFGLGPGGFVVDESAAEKLRDLFERSGELLPLEYKNEKYYLVNITECINVLDEDKTDWESTPTGVKFRIKKYAFKRNRLTETPLFKIPETCKGDVLTFSGLKCEDEEFKSRVEKEGLTGLGFVEIWNDED